MLLHCSHYGQTPRTSISYLPLDKLQKMTAWRLQHFDHMNFVQKDAQVAS